MDYGHNTSINVYEIDYKPQTIAETPVNHTDHFELKQRELYFSRNTDLEMIISSIYGSFDSNVPVHIDYSSLDPGILGTYQILLAHGGMTDILMIHISGD